MRHTMATNAAHAGVDGATLQALGGWKTRRMTERYTHPGQMRDAMDKLASIYSAGRNGRSRPRAAKERPHNGAARQQAKENALGIDTGSAASCD